MSSNKNQSEIASLTRDMYTLALQCFGECNYKNSQHELERVTGIFFDIQYARELIQQGEWKTLKEYILGFTSHEMNSNSTNIFFEIAKQEFLEAIDREDRDGAIQILNNEVSLFEGTYHDEVCDELARLVWTKKFRETPAMSKWKDSRSSRGALVTNLTSMFRQNPDIEDKLEFPKYDDRMGELADQCLNYQYKDCAHFSDECKSGRVTLLQDHQCQTNECVALVPFSHPQLHLPSASTIVSEGLDLRSLASSGEDMGHISTSSLSSPHVPTNNAPPRFDLNCLPEDEDLECMPTTEAAYTLALPPLIRIPFGTPRSHPPTTPQSSTQVATPTKLRAPGATTEQGSSSRRQQKRTRSISNTRNKH